MAQLIPRKQNYILQYPTWFCYILWIDILYSKLPNNILKNHAWESFFKYIRQLVFGSDEQSTN